MAFLANLQLMGKTCLNLATNFGLNEAQRAVQNTLSATTGNRKLSKVLTTQALQPITAGSDTALITAHRTDPDTSQP